MICCILLALAEGIVQVVAAIIAGYPLVGSWGSSAPAVTQDPTWSASVPVPTTMATSQPAMPSPTLSAKAAAGKASASTPAKAHASAPSSSAPTAAALQRIPAGDIVSIEVRTATGGIVVPLAGASGAIVPVRSSLCHDSATCYDPPTLNEVAWAAKGALPSWPQSDTVYVFGHANRSGSSAFNPLPQVSPGDVVSVRTTHGLFTYVVFQTEDIPFAKLAKDSIWKVVPDRLVMMTCQTSLDRTSYVGTRTVSAKLVKAVALG